MHAPRLDWTISIGNMISLGGTIVGGIAVAAILYSQVQTMAGEIATVKAQVESQRQNATALDGRLIRLETRMDTIIEQNSSILSELRRSPPYPGT
jgi:septal ring factor EnvC (AmiA/AmiB activator)